MDDSIKPPHIVIVPSPGMGHLIPLIQFAKRLIDHHNFSISFVIPSNGPPTSTMKSTLAALPNSISSVFLPPVNFDDLPSDVKIETKICLTITRSLPALRQAVGELSKTRKLAALVADLFGTDVFDVAFELKVKPYIFFPSTAMCLSLIFLHLPKLDEMVSCEFRELDEPFRIPGCVPVHGGDLLDPLQDRKNDAYKWCLHNAKRYRLAEGIIVNSFNALEGSAIKALKEPEMGKPPVYPVGPIIQTGSPDRAVESSGCLKWLDNQPHGSVLYVSFGSGGTLSYAQMTELALGLEASEERFVWVVRIPNEEAANATFFDSGGVNKSDPLDFLPNGFLERTKGRGLVVLDWAPQAQILGHRSTGGFLSHCGWNSILESVVYGVPMIAWPLYAEQKMNAILLTEDLKVALRPVAGADGVIRRVEITKVVKSLMEGEEGKEIRYKMSYLKDAAATTLGEDGESTKALSELASNWKLS